MATAIKKISIKNVMGGSGAKAMVPLIGKVICGIGGRASGYRVAHSQYGESCGFQGQFVAINTLTGEQFTSNEAFLPRDLENTIKERLKNAPNMEIDFQAEVLVADHPSGFCYVVRPVSTKETVAQHQQLLAGLSHAVSEAKLLTMSEKVEG